MTAPDLLTRAAAKARETAEGASCASKTEPSLSPGRSWGVEA